MTATAFDELDRPQAKYKMVYTGGAEQQATETLRYDDPSSNGLGRPFADCNTGVGINECKVEYLVFVRIDSVASSNPLVLHDRFALLDVRARKILGTFRGSDEPLATSVTAIASKLVALTGGGVLPSIAQVSAQPTASGTGPDDLEAVIARYAASQGPVAGKPALTMADLDGDGRPEAVATFCINENAPGGKNAGASNPANVHCSLALFKQGPNGWIEIDAKDLGQGRLVGVTNGTLSVETLRYGAGDPFCCPRQKEDARWQLRSGKLVTVSSAAAYTSASDRAVATTTRLYDWYLKSWKSVGQGHPGSWSPMRDILSSDLYALLDRQSRSHPDEKKDVTGEECMTIPPWGVNQMGGDPQNFIVGGPVVKTGLITVPLFATWTERKVGTINMVAIVTRDGAHVSDIQEAEPGERYSVRDSLVSVSKVPMCGFPSH